MFGTKSLVTAVVVGLAPLPCWAQDAFKVGDVQFPAPIQLAQVTQAASPAANGLTLADADETATPATPSNQGTTDNTSNSTSTNNESSSTNPWEEPGTTSGYRNQANEIWGPQAGDWEFTFGGTGANSRDFNTSSYGVAGGIGYYLTRNFEFGLRQTFAATNSPYSSGWMGVTKGAIDFNLPLGRFVPFVGVNGGASYGERQNWEPVVAPEVGLKFYLYPKTFIYGLGEYDWYVNHAFGAGSFAYTVGLGINF